MDREISSAISLAASLMAMALVITLVMFTVSLGQGVKEDAYEYGAQVETGLNSGQLSSLNGKTDKIMTKAAIYALLSQEHDAVNTLTFDGARVIAGESGRWFIENGDPTGPEYIFREDILAEDLGGKVIVTVTKTPSSLYDVVVQTSDIYGET